MRLNRWASVMAIGSLAGLLAGCDDEENIDSSDIKTHGIYADFAAASNGKTTTVDAVLLAGGDDSNVFVDLEAGDTLLAKIDDGTSQTLRGDADGKHYKKTFDVGEGKVTISFQREDDEDAPNSYVTLPDPFAMSLDADELERGEDLVVTWEPANDGGTMHWKVSGDCIWGEDGSTNDDGKYTISSDDIEVHATDKGESCKVTVTLERRRNGQVDSAFGEGGKFVGIQRRSKTFMSTPGPEETDEEPEATGGKSGSSETGGSANEDTGGAANAAGASNAEQGGSSSTTGGAGGAANGQAGSADAEMGGSNPGAAGSAETGEAAAGSNGEGGSAGSN